MESLRSRNLIAKTTSYGRLFILEVYLPTFKWNIKEFDVHEG
jgi:hypothetical protein